MNFVQAFNDNLIERFEIMTLAEQISLLNNKGFHITSFKKIDFCEGKFSFQETVKIKKKEVLFYFSMLLAGLCALTNKRLTSIFMNHYLACQNKTELFKYLPKSRKRPFVMACGGLSGSGKSRVAREMAPLLTEPLGAVVIRDDIIRKQIAGVSFNEELGHEWYTSEIEKKVYHEMRRQAKHALLAGYPVILDALFYNPQERKNAEDLAQQLKLPFEGFWMEAPLATRAKRVTTRKNNPSDIKSEEDLVQQLYTDVGDVSWKFVYTNGTKEETISKVRILLKKYLM